MVPFNPNQPMTIVGSKAPQPFIFKSESHKLNQAFKVKAGKTIYQGQPVALNADGTVEPYRLQGAPVSQIYLGIAHTDSIAPAYTSPDVEVTVMVEAFAVVYGKANSETALPCGFLVAGDVEEESGFVLYTEDKGKYEGKFLNITPNAAKGDLIQVLVM